MVPLAGPGFIREPFFSSSWEEFDAERGRRLESCGGGFWDQVGGEFKVDSKQYNCKVERDMKEFEAELSQSSTLTFHMCRYNTTFGLVMHRSCMQPLTRCVFALDSGVGRRGWRG